MCVWVCLTVRSKGTWIFKCDFWVRGGGGVNIATISTEIEGAIDDNTFYVTSAIDLRIGYS